MDDRLLYAAGYGTAALAMLAYGLSAYLADGASTMVAVMVFAGGGTLLSAGQRLFGAGEFDVPRRQLYVGLVLAAIALAVLLFETVG